MTLIFPQGCVSRTDAISVSPEQAAAIDVVYVERNAKDFMEGFYPELVRQVEALGYKAVPFDGPQRPEGARYVLKYRVDWEWDLRPYIRLFRATLWDGSRVISEAEYQANMGGRLTKATELQTAVLPKLLPPR